MFGFKSQDITDKIQPPFPLGHRFQYLGVDMVVSRYYYSEDVRGGIVANYIANGTIKDHVFLPVEFPALVIEAGR